MGVIQRNNIRALNGKPCLSGQVRHGRALSGSVSRLDKPDIYVSRTCTFQRSVNNIIERKFRQKQIYFIY